MAHIQLVAFDNAVGNSKDLMLLETALKALGHHTTRRIINASERRQRRGALRFWWHRFRSHRRAQRDARFDITIFLEHVYPQALGFARAQVLIPNPEWFDRHDRRWLTSLSELWSKTRQAHELFSNLTPNVQFLGFTSEDGYAPHVLKQPKFIHLAGKSRMKGTQDLLNCWALHPDWPTLTVIHSGSVQFNFHNASNLISIDRYLSSEELTRLLNEHRFHLCPSETEGWGHYIPEAMSMKNTVLTLDAPPMNEHIDATRGILFHCQLKGTQHIAPLYCLDDKALIEWMHQWRYHLSGAEFDSIGDRAREHFLANHAQFIAHLQQRFTEILNRLNHASDNASDQPAGNHHRDVRSGY